MDFFQAQDEARRRTKWLVLMFVVSLVVVVAAVNVLVWAVSSGVFAFTDSGPTTFTNAGGVRITTSGRGAFPAAGVLAVTSLLTAGIVLVASLFKSLELRGGGAVVAKDLGGRLVPPHSTDPEEQRLVNVVEEMAIASGVPAPQVYVMDDEEGINAFAAGTEPANAVIGVTRGCLQRLSRSELQGVIAHEFSHILNGDMRLNMRLIGLVFGLMVITLMGRLMLNVLRYSRFDTGRRGEGALLIVVLVVLGIGLMAIGAVGTLCGRLIQAAISRQREFLADASAVQFTREPEGIAGALKKIGGQGGGSRVRAPKAIEASHMFFADGGMFAFGFRTHPPLEVRIRAVETGWDGKFVQTELPPVARRVQPPPLPRRGPVETGATVMMLDHLGDSERTRLQSGRVLRDRLDFEWIEAAHGREEAQALVFGLLLAEDDELREGEVAFLSKSAGEDAAQLAVDWQHTLRDLHSAQKIALVDLCIPTLRRLTIPEYERFVEITKWLIASDAEVDLFEYMLQHVVARHLATHFTRRGIPKIRFRRMEDLAGEANVLASAMARLQRDSESAARALAAVQAEWQDPGGWQPRLLEASRCGPGDLHRALERFETATPLLKKQILRVVGLAAAHDGVLSSREVELLRATADAIGCGIPPFVGDLARR